MRAWGATSPRPRARCDHAGVSDRTARGLMIALTIVGVLLAAYLTYVHYAKLHPFCTTGNACERVQTSSYATLGGSPVALIGLIGYLLILGSLLGLRGENALLATTALTIGGLAFSAYLTYAELFQIHAVCEECVASAVIVLALTAIAIYRLLWSASASPLAGLAGSGLERDNDEAGGRATGTGAQTPA
ncbi:MAG: hypothetical protein DLM63_01880 [Solirubrobacterales bacterium]|nr:MAG: hypothetical protein DLM63_01880 [Solirubrobacterales bacterium]